MSEQHESGQHYEEERDFFSLVPDDTSALVPVVLTRLEIAAMHDTTHALGFLLQGLGPTLPALIGESAALRLLEDFEAAHEVLERIDPRVHEAG